MRIASESGFDRVDDRTADLTKGAPIKALLFFLKHSWSNATKSRAHFHSITRERVHPTG